MVKTTKQVKATPVKKAAKATAKAAPKAAVVNNGALPSNVTITLQAPTGVLFTTGPNIWPVKAQTGNSIRAYCYSIALQLAQQLPGGFTTLQLATAFCIGQQQAVKQGYKLPSAGFGTNGIPNGVAKQHANWFCGVNNKYCIPVKANANTNVVNGQATGGQGTLGSNVGKTTTA